MKKRYSYHTIGPNMEKKTVEREFNYIPIRYIVAILITVLEIVAVIGIVVALCYYVPYFYIVAYVTELYCVIRIISSDDNPDYKVPWLLFVLVLPVAGFMLYFMFYNRKLKKKYIKRLYTLAAMGYERDDSELLLRLDRDDKHVAAEARMLTNISNSHVFCDTGVDYFALGEDMMERMLCDLETAEHFIFMEYFIIEEGKFWNAILDILKRKASEGVLVRVLYDDIGCMTKLPGNYDKVLREAGIEATVFSRLIGNADSEFNNRSHRKILVIDGRVGYTGGVNIADEYINEVVHFGHWKDTGVRLEGEAVYELTRLFLIDYGINVRELPELPEGLYPPMEREDTEGYVIPFGDGPRPLYKHRVGKSVIVNMLNGATERMYMTSPYLIIDNELCSAMEQAAMRGVDVRIIVPHIPDKKIIFEITRSFYNRLMEAGVKIYEYEPGFIHAKSYIADGRVAMIGTINLDYRSLVHHFENGVWMYGTDVIGDMERDFEATLEKCIPVTPDMLKTGGLQRLIRAVVRIFSPLL